MIELSPWNDPAWLAHAEAERDAALAAVGRERVGPAEIVKSWGRSHIVRVPTAGGGVWVKYSYRLPPGEERVIAALSRRWPDRVPRIVSTWPGAVAMAPLPGRELTETDPVSEWTATAETLGELAAGERAHIGPWCDLGVRDRRPVTWEDDVQALLESPVVRQLDSDLLRRFEALVPELVTSFVDAFASPPSLVHQDSGCCNVHITAHGPVIFDWADVVIGHPVFSCDRLLDQAPEEYHDAVISAFSAPLGMGRGEFRGMRRSNVLHEVLRYHDEIAYLAPGDPARTSLGRSVRSQLRVLIEHETARRL